MRLGFQSTFRASLASLVAFAALLAAGCSDSSTGTIGSQIITGVDDEIPNDTPGDDGDVGDVVDVNKLDAGAPAKDAGSVLGTGGGAGTGGGSGTGGGVGPQDAGLSAAVDAGTNVPIGLTGPVALGSVLRTITSLNMRTGPGPDHSIRLVLPSGVDVVVVNSTMPQNGWYNVSFNGVDGWSSGRYLVLVREPTESPTARDLAVDRARSGVGFSYWWGHGRWVPNGATSTNIGTCVGNCPDCVHTGQYGADCSGYVAQIWHVPETNNDPTDDKHPYSTLSFIGTNSRWRTVTRENVQRGDSFVYNIDGAGHMFLFESGDAWGDVWAYEARGCSYGIVHNLRTVTSAFKVIARTGY